jgi:hypothetical protein
MPNRIIQTDRLITRSLAAIDDAIKALKRRRDEIDNIIQGLQRQKKIASKGNPMSEEAKAKRRATYAKNHPGWKPKKKNHRKPDSD